MISFPFDNKSAEIQDRAIDSDTFSEYLKRMIGTNGVFSDLSSKMLVTAGEEMTVIVKPGDGFIEGRIFIEDKDRTLSIQASESADRIDTVVVRLNKAERSTDLYVVKGTAGTSPKQPELTREGDIYELGIANIYIPKLTTTISQERITDTRLNSERCGVAPTLGKIDTTELYLQYQTSLSKFLETVEQAIDGTLAGNLQNQITENRTDIDELIPKVNDLEKIKRVLLFEGAVNKGTLNLNDNAENYSELLIAYSSAADALTYDNWSRVLIFPENKPSTTSNSIVISSFENNNDNSVHVTVIGRIIINKNTIKIFYPIMQIRHYIKGEKGHGQSNNVGYYIRQVWGVR